MPIAITEDHRLLADIATDLLARHDALGDARRLLDGAAATIPAYWAALGEVGWLGLAIDETHGGSGFGLPELVVVAEAFGRTVAPGPFVPTIVASALVHHAASAEQARRLLPGLVDGSVSAAVGLGGSLTVRDGAVHGDAVHGDAGVVIGASLASLLVLACGDDVVIVEAAAAGVTITVPKNVDPTRPAARVRLDGVPCEVLPGARRALVDLARLLFAAEATGIAHACTAQAAAYAKVREQFGRVIATFQAVKHHCADMLVAAELATAAVWDAARTGLAGGEQFTYAAAVAATLALDAADLDAQLNIQVHGGIGFTWEHDAHLFARRAIALRSIIDTELAAADVVELGRRGVTISRSIDLPPEAEAMRDQARAAIAAVRDLDTKAQQRALVASGYAVPHWPAPWGRNAGAVEQLVIEQELAAAGVKRPSYSITGWVILTLVQHATDDQIARWVRPALDGDVIWCQLFSEPDAGSDAAGVKTKATRVDGGWLLNGQKVWTSGAHLASFGLATVRTDPDAPKHQGITTVVIDLHAPGVEIRPIKMPSGASEFNEVFFSDVFVPDDDVVGPVNGGWSVARATLGNESVSLGSGDGSFTLPNQVVIDSFDRRPDAVGVPRLARYLAHVQAAGSLNLRSAHRAVAGGGPGPEGAVTKLVLSEIGHDAASILGALAGPDGAFLDGPGMIAANLGMMNRALSIAGGTSEIKRNQIGERLLGLPRDPLLR
jgi:alkylation response protein AidB-like acyl-CoA dehydrogenase